MKAQIVRLPAQLTLEETEAMGGKEGLDICCSQGTHIMPMSGHFSKAAQKPRGAYERKK